MSSISVFRVLWNWSKGYSQSDDCLVGTPLQERNMQIEADEVSLIIHDEIFLISEMTPMISIDQLAVVSYRLPDYGQSKSWRFQ